MTKYLVLDVETTTDNKGSPFSVNNTLCYIGLYDGTANHIFDIEYSDTPYRESLEKVQQIIDDHDCIIAFNAKFDLHWVRKYGIDFSAKKVWDGQLVHFILQNQSAPYPSLNKVAEHYGLEQKLDVVYDEYWSKGINTPDIPKDLLEEYLIKDLEVTYQVFTKQLEEVSQCSAQRQRLISLHNQDLLVLEEMEYNGILYDEQTSIKLGKEMEDELAKIDLELVGICGVADINFNSNDHLSCLLYGGDITIPKKELVGVYKTGARKGEDKFGWVDYTYTLPRLVEPLKGSELKKDGYFSTDEQTLRSLRGTKDAKEIIGRILKRSGLEKRRGTYYQGLPELRQSQGWLEGKLHGQLNQCVARTGRLSSSRPNLQNFDGEIKELFFSRYKEAV